MSQFSFEHYTFNSSTLELRTNGKPVELRPKTAELLRALLNGRDVVVSKRELIKRIWHTEHVTDQSVFQAISELRATLAPLTAIRTFPNRGYQWVVPVSETTKRRSPVVLAAAASVLVAVAGVFGLSHLSVSVPQSKQHSSQVTSLPALVAFSEGAQALQRGDTAKALELLQLSVIERPEFTEARLLLAEAHLLNGNALEGRALADSVMTALDSSVNAYSLIAVMDLLSRADQQLGQMNSALEWAARAADQANTNGFECTAADLHDRVLVLVQDSEFSVQELQASPVFASLSSLRLVTAGTASERVPDNGPVQSPLTSVEQLAENDWLEGSAQTRPAHCERLRGGTSGGLLVPSEPTVSVESLSAKRLIISKPLI